MNQEIEVQVDDAPDVDSEEVPSVERLRCWAAAALGADEGRGVCIRVVGRQEGRQLNAQYRESHRATNVLAFPANGSLETEVDLLGDIAICAPVVRDEAPDENARVRHWAHMVVHGVLHLLGHDHQEPSEARRMEAREERILRGLGFSSEAQQEQEQRP